MTLEDAEKLARKILDEVARGYTPDESWSDAVADALVAILPVVKAAEEWRAANPGSPKWAAKSWRLRDAIDQLRREMEER